MSIQNAKALYSRLLIDEKFRKQLEGAACDRDRAQILQDAGFSCTQVELKIAKNELLHSLKPHRIKDGELNSIEEEGIIGGSLSQSWLDCFDYLLFI